MSGDLQPLGSGRGRVGGAPAAAGGSSTRSGAPAAPPITPVGSESIPACIVAGPPASPACPAPPSEKRTPSLLPHAHRHATAIRNMLERRGACCISLKLLSPASRFLTLHLRTFFGNPGHT